MRQAVALLLVVLATAFAQTANESAVGSEIDSLRKLESQKVVLDALPKSDVKPVTHEKTPAELLAEDPEAIFIGRDVQALTHPSITSKVDESAKGRGHIEGWEVLCEYLLSATLGVDETVDVHGVRLYNIAARLECPWAKCRLCQQRMTHFFDYCVSHGLQDHTGRGLCEDRNPIVQDLRLKKMVFHNNPQSCRTWLAQQVLNQRCAGDDAAICQGAYDASEICHALGINPKQFLQSRNLLDLAPWFCFKMGSCSENYRLPPQQGVDIVTPSIGNEKDSMGLDVIQYSQYTEAHSNTN